MRGHSRISDALRRRSLVVVLAVVVGVTLGPTPTAVTALASRTGAPEPLATAEPEPATVPTAAIGDDSELLVVGTPSADGYLLEVAAEETSWQLQPLAVLNTGSVDTRSWVGYECTTGDGRFVVAVVAPWEASNQPALRDRGAVAFGVEIRTGEVTRLADEVALKHFNPACGESTVGLVRHRGTDQEASTVLVVDPAAGEMVTEADLDGQIVGAVPSDAGTYVFRDLSMARLDGDEEVDAVATGGQPYMAMASPDGVTFLAADGDSAKVQRLRGDDIETVGEYELGEVKLHEGFGGDVTAVVRGAPPGDDAEGVHWVERAAGEPLPDAVSGSGSAALQTTDASPAAPTEAVVTADGDVVMERPRAQVDMSLPEEVLEYEVSEQDVAALQNISTPVCAVPRNQPGLMARQPTPAQVRWAIEQAVSENTSFQRPAGWIHSGSSGYAPSAAFPVPDLAGPTKKVPASVAWATFVQETNWKHASRRSLPGSSANSTVASYYGAPWTDPLASINYDDADCGYGLAQVTDGMRNDDGMRSQVDERRIALDYYANASAGVQILSQKWNEIQATHGITVNNGDAKYLENWYLALWAYNSGWNTPDVDGNYGLGWTNNPRNSDYPPDRDLFLRYDLDDARRPSDWPYQERVFGWMESPLWDPGNSSIRYYPRPQGNALLKVPGVNEFCTPANHCDPDDEPGATAYCQRSDRHCWWHFDTVDFANCATPGVCAQSVAATPSGSEPAAGDSWPPNCTGLPQGVTVPPEAILVDDIPGGIHNVEGCPPSQTEGTFEVEFGEDAGGAPLAEINWHQLGTGYGGHTWFTDNVDPDDTAHTVVGRWTPGDPLWGRYAVYAHIPAAGATSTSATYSISTGFGETYTSTIDHGWHEDRNNSWARLGSFNFFGEGGHVELTNANGEPPGDTTMGFDAMLFVPEGGHQNSTRLLPRGASWDYLATGNVPSGWATPGFDSSPWSSGRAPLGAGVTGLSTTINRSGPTHVTDLFRRTFHVDSLDSIWALEMTMRYDDAVAVWLNGTLVHRANMPTSPNPPAPGTLASACREGPAQDAYESTVIVPGLDLVEGENTIAVELHQCSAASSDSAFDMEVVGLTSPSVSDLTFDAAYVDQGDDRLRGADVSFSPVAGGIGYELYELDYLSGPDAVPELVADIPSSAPLGLGGKITWNVDLGFERAILREYYVVARVAGGGVSPPSLAQRVHIIPNVTDAADNSGPDVSRSFVTPPAAPPGAIPALPVGLTLTRAPNTLPSSGPGVRGGGIILVAAAAAAFYDCCMDLELETRVPTQVLTVPNDHFSGRSATPQEVTLLADKLQARPTSPSLTLTRQQYETIARQCLESPVPNLADYQTCDTITLLVPGNNDREATNHYLNTISAFPRFAILTRDVNPVSGKEGTVPRNWYNGRPGCTGTPPAGKSCDEYPFYAAAQNAGPASNPPVGLAWVNSTHNSHVGSVLGAMYRTCGVQGASAPTVPDGGAYAVIPMPQGVTIDSTYICSPAPK